MRIEKVLQWNMGFAGKVAKATATSRLAVLKALVAKHSPSIVALQEAAPLHDLAPHLPSLQIEVGPGRLVTAFSASKWTLSARVDPLGRAFAVMLDHASGSRLRVWNLHGPALNVSDDDKRVFIRRDLLREVAKLRAQDPDREEIIIGDFNLPPFDPAIVREDGLHANRSLTWAYRRRNTGIDRPLFNPSWQVFGAVTAPHGTYYRSRVDVDGPWSVLDQALITPELGLRGHAHVQVLASVGSTELWARSSVRAPRRNVGSDHLPVCVDVQVA